MASLRKALALALLVWGLPLIAFAAQPASVSDAGPESLLAQVFAEIEQDRLDEALGRVDALLASYPTFRLAHLIRGDLLLARARPLTTLGNAGHAPQDRLLDLREEAVARLKGYREKPRADRVPRYLLQMHPEQRYAIVVDTAKSRLYVYENNDGRPRFVADYYISSGKAGSDKSREGDKKTPLGVYTVTRSLPRSKLSDFYGSGAYPISYPNEWDRRMGRNGHGIWLHGTPPNTYSRPPRASDGCVVLTNEDLNRLANALQPGLTPVIISDSVEWLTLDDWQSERSALNATIEEWRRDWESGDAERYLRHYSPRFETAGQGYAEWSAAKRRIAATKQWIRVGIANTSLFRSPGREEMVVVTFDQDYRSNNLSDAMRKRQYWVREDGRWKIIYEGPA